MVGVLKRIGTLKGGSKKNAHKQKRRAAVPKVRRKRGPQVFGWVESADLSLLRRGDSFSGVGAPDEFPTKKRGGNISAGSGSKRWGMVWEGGSQLTVAKTSIRGYGGEREG